MKIREDAEAIATDDFYYDLFAGGYIKPEEMLSEEDAKKVREAVSVITDFVDSLEEAGKLEEM